MLVSLKNRHNPYLRIGLWTRTMMGQNRFWTRVTILFIFISGILQNTKKILQILV
jgi:hypothetical protein